MIHRTTAGRTIAVVVIGLVIAPLSFAQPRRGDRGAPRYNPSTETTVNGTVESIQRVAGPGGGRGRQGLGGTHVTLKTIAGTVYVHLGPTAFLDEQKIAIAKGDTLEIVGSRVTVDDQSVLLAKSVKKGDSLWTLRDASGLPLWRGGPR